MRKTATEFRRINSRRLWMGVGFLVLLVLVSMAYGSYLIARLLLTGDAPSTVTGYRLAGECMRDHLLPVAHAAERYYRDKGHYPERIEEVYPTYLEKRSALTCPATEGEGFTYTPPQELKPNEPIVACPHHPFGILKVVPRGKLNPGHTQWQVRAVPRRSP